MKKLGSPQPTEHLLISRGNSRELSASGRAIFSVFGLDDDEEVSLPRIYERSVSQPAESSEDLLPENGVRVAALRFARRNA